MDSNIINNNFIKDNILHRLYRFQSDSDFSSFKMSMKRIDVNSEGNLYLTNNYKLKYVYFSKNFIHHKYFVYLKLSKFLKEIARIYIDKDFNYLKFIEDKSIYYVIVDFIENNKEIFNFDSIRLILTNRLSNIICDSSVNPQFQNNSKKLYLRLNDVNIYDGVYGISLLWLNLIINMSLIYEIGKINYEDILLFLDLMKYNMQTRMDGYRRKCLDPTPFIKENMNLFINNNINSESNVIRINESIDEIIHNKLYLPNSPFDRASMNERSILIDEYNKIRKLILK